MILIVYRPSQYQAVRTVVENSYPILCFSHETVPHVPEIAGLSSFQGGLVHSHDFRSPEAYRDQVVLCIGSGPSAADIGGLVASKASQVST